MASLAKLGYTGITVENLGQLIPPDEYEEELEVMAEVRGYFQVSYKVKAFIPQSSAACPLMRNLFTHLRGSLTIFLWPLITISCLHLLSPCKAA